MARFARVAVANVPHHVTQRGNARQFLLASEVERRVYLDLLGQSVKLHGVSVLGYCVMSNHVHLIAVPQRRESLALALKSAHGRYAAYWNAAHQSSGHAWQGRFYSCPLDETHLWIALRYVELNPVRACLVGDAGSWEWSSAPAHCGRAEPGACLDAEPWARRWSSETWRKYLAGGEGEAELCAIRKCTHTGRPLGSGEFIRSLECATARRLEVQRGGRPRQAAGCNEQGELALEG